MFALVPVVLIISALGEVLDLAVVVATPIADLLPKDVVGDPQYADLIAIVLIVMVSFLFGLLMMSSWARSIGRAMESRVLSPLPGYRAIKALTHSIKGSEEETAFKPSLLDMGSGQRQMAYLVENHGNGFATVLLPIAPTPMAGAVRVVPIEQLELIDAPMSKMTQALSEWGIGTRGLVGSSTSESDSKPSPVT